MGSLIKIPRGARFGSWTVIERAGSSRQGVVYLCRCDCGTEKQVDSATLRHGKSTRCQSCSNRETSIRHGMVDSPEYIAWRHMFERCSSVYPRSGDYGERGISVCDEWSGPGGFEVFLEHVGRRPSSKHSLDRIDNDKGYEPGNVRWATRREQQRNMRSNRTITIDGVTKCIAEWAEESPVSECAVRTRLHRGWEPRDAVFEPSRMSR
jgi:hypothetical protein